MPFRYQLLFRQWYYALLMGWLIIGSGTLVRAQSKEVITYSEHIGPLLAQHCAPCHRLQGEAPFSLLSYDDANSRAHTLVAVTQSGYMPPWRANPHYRSFANERLLSPTQIAQIRRWVENGAPQGSPRKAQKLAAAAQANASARPGLVLRPTQVYKIPGTNSENFVLFKIPFELADSQAVRAVEFIPGNRRLVHHANYAVQMVPTNVDIHAGRDHIVSDQFLTNMREYLPLMTHLVHYGGWVPGTSQQEFPAGVGFTMPKRGVILLTVHYGPSPIDTSDLSTIKLYFSKQPIQRPLQAVSIGSAGAGTISPPLVIPADSVKGFEATWPVRDDVSLLYIWPHMHLLGQTFKAWAITPTGETVPLVSIPAWDFRWQEAYRCRQFIHLPAGSVVKVWGSYDNTARNPNNPFSPPRRIISQELMESRSEMLNLVLLMLPYQPGDENRTQ